LVRLLAKADGVSSSSFTVVMATGIVSIGARLLSVAVIDVALFALNIVVYAGLWLLTAVRIARHPSAVMNDVRDQSGGVGVLAVVAATCVIGAQTILISHRIEIATALLVIGVGLWLLLGYGVFTAVTIKRQKPSPSKSITGEWLLAVVATESIAVLLALLSPHWQQSLRLDANFAAVSMWLCGGMLYIWIASLIFYRWMFLRLSPADVTPPYWINMGAMAIAALAGSLLLEDAPDAPWLESLRPFVEGSTLLFWATATWWIPPLAILAVWRHGVCRVPIRYDSLVWSAVFPLGMYAVATSQLATEISLKMLAAVAHAFFWIALGAWLLAFVGVARRGRSRLWRAATAKRVTHRRAPRSVTDQDRCV
jgi:tellurite resistance protein TehA-like permease